MQFDADEPFPIDSTVFVRSCRRLGTVLGAPDPDDGTYPILFDDAPGKRPPYLDFEWVSPEDME